MSSPEPGPNVHKFGALQVVESQIRKNRIPSDIVGLTKQEYEQARARLEKEAGVVNRGLLLFLNEVENAWFEESPLTGYIAKFITRSIKEKIMRESPNATDRARYTNAYLALLNRGLIKQDGSVDLELVRKHIDDFIAHRRAKETAEAAGAIPEAVEQRILHSSK